MLQKHAQSGLTKHRKAARTASSLSRRQFIIQEKLNISSLQPLKINFIGVNCQAEGSFRLNYLTLVMLSTGPLH